MSVSNLRDWLETADKMLRSREIFPDGTGVITPETPRVLTTKARTLLYLLFLEIREKLSVSEKLEYQKALEGSVGLNQFCRLIGIAWRVLPEVEAKAENETVTLAA